VNQVITRRFGQAPESALLSVAEKFCASHKSEPLPNADLSRRFDEVIKRALTSGSTVEGRSFDTALRFSLDEFIKSTSREFGDPLCDLVLSQLDNPDFRLRSAQRIFAILTHGLKTMIETVQRAEETAKTDLAANRASLFPAAAAVEAEFSPSAARERNPSYEGELLRKHVRLRMQAFTLREARKTFQRINDHLTERLAKPLERVGSTLRRLGDVFQKQAQEAAAAVSGRSAEQLEDLPRLIVKQVMARSADLVRIADHRLTGDLVSNLSEFDDRNSLTDVASSILSAAISTVSDALKEVDFDQVINGGQFDGMRIADWTKRNLSLAMPALLTKCGGDSRLLLAVPERSEPGIIADCLETQFDEFPTTIPATSGSVTLCYEAGGISLKNVLLRLVKDRPNAIEFVGRLHTRIDVEWTKVTDLIS
jgi:hypothetical protein